MNVTHFKGVVDECAITYFMSLNGNLVVINNTFISSTIFLIIAILSLKKKTNQS